MAQIWPPQSMVYEFNIDSTDAELEASLTKLTQESVRYLGSVGMPETIEIGFDKAPLRHVAPTAHPEELSIVVTSKEDAGSIAYDVSSTVEDQQYVDEIRYQLWRPSREGFMLPWGIKVDTMRRTAHPARRSRRFNIDKPDFSAKSPLQNTLNVLVAIRRGVYTLHTPVVRHINGELQ